MIWKTKFALFSMLLTAGISLAQLNTYNFSREITEVSDTWHSIVLPNEVFGKVNSNLNDIRIYGITETDTIEVPYLVRIASEKQIEEKIDFTLLNSSKKGDDYYFTFEIPSEKAINEINLKFRQRNFNWSVTLEGSEDNKEWFSIVEDYRILSIKNEQTDYQYSTLRFPKSKYRYLRLRINSPKKPELITAETNLSSVDSAVYNTYSIKNFSTEENKKLKRTIVDIEFSEPLPVSFVSLKIKDKVDYYRPVIIKYLTDSIKTEKGWKYNYENLSLGMLSSLEDNDLHFRSTQTKKLRLEVENFDNRPLQIVGATTKGYVHQLIARFTEPANYYLVYGNSKATKPIYDISKFTENIPSNITEVKLSEEKPIDKKPPNKVSPLFENKLWLWIVMGSIIVLLGWFTLKMMRKG